MRGIIKSPNVEIIGETNRWVFLEKKQLSKKLKKEQLKLSLTTTKGFLVPEGEMLTSQPGQTVLGITQEKITLGDGICGWLEGRSRFARVGLLVHISASFMQPGICNHQVLEISNFGPIPLNLIPGTPVCQFIFQRCENPGKYQGVFSGQTPENFAKD